MKNFLKFTSRDRPKENGITLIALIITIIVMIILTAFSVNFFLGDDGLITKSRMSAFAREMDDIKEKVELKKSKHVAELLRNKTDGAIEDNHSGNSEFYSSLFLNKFEGDDLEDANTSLKREILYAREGFPSEKSIDSYIDDDIEKIENDKNLYIIDEDTAGKADTYIWDMITDIVYKIKPTRIGKSVYHSYIVAELGLNPTGDEIEMDLLVEDDAQITQVEDIYYYEPDLKGFSRSDTYIIYYSQNYLNGTGDSDNPYIEVPILEYLNDKKKQITRDGKTYIFHNYKNQVWGNVKTYNNGLECWWVWIPRYAYKINESEKTTDIKFIGLDNKLADGSSLPNDYTVHPAFNPSGSDGSKNLKGIWMSKYEASLTTDYEPNGKCFAPDLTGFDIENTEIVIYNNDGTEVANTYTLKDILKPGYTTNGDILRYGEIDETIISSDNWYNYTNQKWANIKTASGGLECWWVWIPRYAYKIVDGVQEADILFVDLKNRPIDKAKYGTKLPEGYIVHPAFDPSGEDGSKHLKGIWVSKYEASNNTSERPTQSEKCYAPNLKGFDINNTQIVIYNNAGTEVANTYTLKDVLKSGYQVDENCILREGEIDETKLSFDDWYNYPEQRWANIKTIANGIECWWVWIPRYAYLITPGITETEVVFTDTNDTPYDKERFGNISLQACYIPHPAFDEVEKDENGEDKIVKRLEGIWMSKYEASYNNDYTPTSATCYAPDLIGFDIDKTKIVTYNSDGSEVSKEYTLRDVLKTGYTTVDLYEKDNNGNYVKDENGNNVYAGTALKDGEVDVTKLTEEWYDYTKQKWANIKTEANGLECWWVWIPRYAYQMTKGITEANVLFIDLDNKPMDKGKYGNTLPQIYTVSPAFTPSGSDGSKNLKGIWMSKYEASWR